MKDELKYFSLAHKLNEKHKMFLLEKKVHFRASKNSFALISLSEESPEQGIKCSYTEYSSEKDISELIKKAIKKIDIPKRPTPEKRLQAFIINYALNNNNELLFDKNIKFITSEIAIYNKDKKKIVTDILGYNETNNQLCVIELKDDRQEKRLIEQVNNFENIINEDKTEFFSQLLSIHGFKSSNNTPLKVAKFVVWPHGTASPKEKLKAEKITEITFQPDYSFKNFN
ncbi:MAG TPA: hypothetical protein VNI52_01590 [Sphingobacteriaceae bacterium]|nr:hypothetical protein [Sphingobacteriaceae bacterium]